MVKDQVMDQVVVAKADLVTVVLEGALVAVKVQVVVDQVVVAKENLVTVVLVVDKALVMVVQEMAAVLEKVMVEMVIIMDKVEEADHDE